MSINTLHKGDDDDDDKSKQQFGRFCCVILLTSVKLGIEDFRSALLRSCELRENRCSDRHSLRRDVNEMLLILSAFAFRFRPKQKRYCWCLQILLCDWELRENRCSDTNIGN